MSVFLQFYNTYICGATDNTIDLGTTSKQFKNFYLNGLAYIDGFGEDTDMGDFDIHSLDGLYGFDDSVFIDMGADGRIIIQADGAGTPFATPDIDITGTTYFDDDMGLLLDKKILFGDTAVYILSDDDGHLDLTADVSVDINADANISAKNIITDTSTGTKIGTSTAQLLGFYNATPVDQPATVTDAATQDVAGADTVDEVKIEADLTSCKNAINAIIDRLQELGLIA